MNQSLEVYSQFASYLDGKHFNYFACEHDGEQVREAFLMLEPTICNDVWTSLIP